MVYPANVDLVLKEESWPADAKFVLAEYLASETGKKEGPRTPRFILVQDKKIVLLAAGNAGWKDTMWPKIQEVTGTKA